LSLIEKTINEIVHKMRWPVSATVGHRAAGRLQRIAHKPRCANAA
jgi:hypothetical protein